MAHALPPCHNRHIVDQAFPGNTMILARGNPGLVFERFLRIWHETRNGNIQLEPEFSQRSGKREDLQAFCDEYNSEKTAKDGKGPVAMIHRRLKSFIDPENGKERTYRTRWRIVTGLGADHPLENGFVFDRSSGVPFFPGTSVKGLCRAAAKTVIGLSEVEQNKLFGVDPDQEDNLKNKRDLACGKLVFLPAYPERDHWPMLEVDIVNCHYPSYYRSMGQDSAVSRGPRETDDPVPVPFLTVAAKTPFTFRIGKRNRSVDDELLERAFECLEAGLDYLGLGAKTAAGYGTFET